MSAARNAILGCLLALAGCAGPSGPEVPDPDLDGLEPQVAAALSEARRAVLDDPRSADAWGHLGTVHDAHVLADTAEICYRRAAELAPEDFRWTYLLAIVREINGAGHAELSELFSRAAELRPDYPPVHVRLGDALWRRGRYEEARGELERALELAPDSAMASRRLGQVLLALDDPEAAAAHLRRAIELEPRDLASYTALAQALLRTGRAEEARRATERSRGLEPVNVVDDPVYREEVGARGVTSGQAFARAIGRIREAAYAEAAEDLRLVLEARPDDASTHYWLGTAHQRLGQTGPAVEHLSRAVEIEPTMAAAWLQLAVLLAAEGRVAESKTHLDRAAALRPLGAAEHEAMGRAFEHAGLVDAALAEYEAAVRLDPNHAARQRLADLRHRR